MPQPANRTSRFVIEITRATVEKARRNASRVEIRAYEEDDGTKERRPLMGASTVEGDPGRSGRDHLRAVLHGYIDEIVEGMGEVESAEVTLWPADLRDRRL